jgi:hypothetical protein
MPAPAAARGRARAATERIGGRCHYDSRVPWPNVVELADRTKRADYGASGRDIQRISGIAGNTQPSPATT